MRGWNDDYERDRWNRPPRDLGPRRGYDRPHGRPAPFQGGPRRPDARNGMYDSEFRPAPGPMWARPRQPRGYDRMYRGGRRPPGGYSPVGGMSHGIGGRPLRDVPRPMREPARFSEWTRYF